MATKSLTDGETSNKKRVVICGDGVIRVCTAYFLAKKGIAVTLVEKSVIACAASSKAGGVLAFDWCDGSSVSSLARASFDLHRSLAGELNGVESYGYRPLKTLSLSVTELKPGSGGLGLPAWVNGPAKSPSTIEKYNVEVLMGKLEHVTVKSGRVALGVLFGGRAIVTYAVVLVMGPWPVK